MTWLLKLYPPRWRRRYGEEFLALIAPQPFSLATALDIVGGAIDAWTQPQSHLSTRAGSQPEGGHDHAGQGSAVTMRRLRRDGDDG